MVLRDVGRVLGLSYGHVDRICKMVPFDPSRPLSLQESIDREPRFKEEIKNNVKVKKAFGIIFKVGRAESKYGYARCRGSNSWR